MMEISELRTRYKQILNKRDQWQQQPVNKQNKSLCSSKKSNIKQRVLTQYHDNISTSKIINQKYYNHHAILKLKERIAQNIQIINSKDEEITEAKETVIRYQEKVVALGERLAEQQEKVANLQQRIIEEKINASSLQKQMRNKSKKSEQQKLDREILLSQIQFYKRQISALKRHNKSLTKRFQKSSKQQQRCQQMKNEIVRLRQDVKRMHVFINQYSLNNKQVNFNNKHFVGVCMKELHHWVPTNLIGQTELFLKKEQVASSNTAFLNHLVKFINKYAQSLILKASDAHSQPAKNSKPHQSQIKASKKSCHQRSSSLCEDGQSVMKRTDCLTQSFIKKSSILNKCKKIESRMYTQNIKFPQKNKRGYCNQIFDEYQDVLRQALNQQQIKVKNILLLSDQLRRNISSILE